VPAITRFDTPGSLRDLPAGHAFYDTWHATIAGQIASVTPGNPRGEFFDPSEHNFDRAADRHLTWMGFPRTWMVVNERDNRDAAFAACDTNRDVQDEYLEWHVTRSGGKITKVVFVTETPEYWSALAAADRGAVVRLYRDLVDPAVTEASLFPGGGSYDRLNAWNTTRGIVHYIQGINTLTAAVGLAQGAVNSGSVLDNFDVAGGAPTSADPRVALDIGAVARRGLSVTLAEPIGLYMTDWDDTGWTKPNGRPVGDYWRVRRGEPGRALRLEYEVPPGEGFVVGDIKIGGRPITHGGQIAEHLTVTAAGAAGTRRP
jgi:hypothetical protein